ncbi:hypothetical protein [Lichenibacterium dinghuense]|uniref:hypothetical protein n=1 Tax=Lichenibacterium dinghuense TaxID=2895977 RepID=UPI001F35EB68|nr:hypothetical protein [Lichenibacterium sp. 6Y81]
MSKGNTKAKAASIDMTAPGATRHIEVTVSKQTTDSMREIGGSEWALWNDTLLQRTMLACPQYAGPDGMALDNYNAGVAGLALRAFAPRDEVESMLASAAVAMHASVMECSRRAMLPQQPSDAGSRLRRDAANSARTLIELTEAIQRRRGKGTRQTVRVERVIVNEGGQALVAGAVTTTAPLPASPPAPAAIGQGAAPMAMFDAEPVAVGAGAGEGERDAGSDG